ncbi:MULTISPECIES: acid phosphatase [Rhodanobacter]|uniref:phospholipase C n=1 Tax=Rhodanobacter denitrificans TaxID=666685 RepID=M4NIA9_9GAMM|nr:MULTISPECIES: acid phosphatase [Rhodanobacter]AGG90634.1 acid phosphatase [Rhodanobacter denitrificans]UJM86016.1 acid phosphatase [Rhodanobacter denitrificans]
MTDPIDHQPLAPPDEAPADPARRRLLGGLALAGAALAAGGCKPFGGQPPASAPTVADAALDAQLRRHIRHVVVLYAENRSFNNLFADFPGMAQPLQALDSPAYRQRDRDGRLLDTLPPVWGGLAPHPQTVDDRQYRIDESAISGLPNRPFVLATPDGTPLPHGVITRDLVHRFYENQLQINGGRNDGFVAWGNTGAMTMGHYADGAKLRLWQLARQYTLCDNFFMGAFGGSFLNHQYLAAAQPPYYPHADRSPARFQIATLEGDDPTGIRPKLAEGSPASAMQGRPTFVTHDALTPDFWAVNTIGPAYAPGFSRDKHDPRLTDAASPNTLPAQSHATIGDALSAVGVDWAWYAGAWQLALDGRGDGDHRAFPEVPNFQPHHQPFNYFRQFAPGTAARARHLRDAGTGGESATNHFLAAAAAGTLPPVTFYKPQGDLNMHAGYASVDAGDRHLAQVVQALQASPLWPNMLVVITVDENGGWWDHVVPPKGDRWGPGSRIPALVVSPFAKKGFVDHSVYDTGSILRLITRRFGLAKLPGLKLREQAMIAAGGPPPGDLTAALQFD